MINEIQAHCIDENGNVLYYLTQWDINQKIRIQFEDYTISSAPKVHFSNKSRKEALVVTSTVSNNIVTADIPNEILREPHNLYIYIYITQSGGSKTIVFLEVPIRKRAKPQDFVYSDNVDVIYLEDLLTEVEAIQAQIESVDWETLDNFIENYSVATLTEVRSYIEGS